MKYPDFINNSTFYHLDKSQEPLMQTLALAENIKRVHLLTAKHYDNFETLITDYLHSGIEIFQMQTGIVSHITDGQKYIVKDVVTDLEVIQPGDEYELEGTYCREVYLSQKTLGFPCVANIKELKDHPVYVNLKLEAYLSAPIFVNDELYGTLNFTSVTPREYGFSEHEHDLISMMASSIGNFILLQEKEEKLKKLNFRMKELVGHVSHDLRGPIGSIHGLSEIALSHTIDKEKVQEIFSSIYDESTKSLELVNVILDQAALGTGKISLNKTHFEVLPFLQQSLKNFSHLVDEKELHVQSIVDTDLQLYADKARLLQVFSNLLVNAFKYAKKGSEVELKLTKDEERIHCSISNFKGDVQPELKKSVYKSVGYGLDIVADVLKLHESKMKVDEDETRYCVSFDLGLQEKG